MGAREIRILVVLLVGVSAIPLLTAEAMEEGRYLMEPEDPFEGESVTISFLVMNNSLNRVYGARLSSGNRYFNASAYLTEEINDTATMILFSCVINLEESGEAELIEEHYDGYDWTFAGSFNITVKDKETESGNFLGLPDWYCSVGVIILTLGALFLTWSYFKGRRMRKSDRMGDKEIFKCSDCGRPLKGDEDACPWCGVEITGEEYICGKCRKSVGPDDRSCPHCGASLVTDSRDVSRERKSSNPGSDKKSRSRTTDIPKYSKKKCGSCGTVLLKSESKCPVCGKEDRDPERLS
jgi:RNA polymerase subunit RPABC4/transcription elongation factor Spt4